MRTPTKLIDIATRPPAATPLPVDDDAAKPSEQPAAGGRPRRVASATLAVRRRAAPNASSSCSRNTTSLRCRSNARTTQAAGSYQVGASSFPTRPPDAAEADAREDERRNERWKTKAFLSDLRDPEWRPRRPWDRHVRRPEQIGVGHGGVRRVCHAGECQPGRPVDPPGHWRGSWEVKTKSQSHAGDMPRALRRAAQRRFTAAGARRTQPGVRADAQSPRSRRLRGRRRGDVGYGK